MILDLILGLIHWSSVYNTFYMCWMQYVIKIIHLKNINWEYILFFACVRLHKFIETKNHTSNKFIMVKILWIWKQHLVKNNILGILMNVSAFLVSVADCSIGQNQPFLIRPWICKISFLYIVSNIFIETNNNSMEWSWIIQKNVFFNIS